MATIQAHASSSSLSGTRRISLGPLPLDCLDLDEAVRRIEDAVQGNSQPLHVVTANTQFLGLARRDPSFAAVVGRAGMVVLDGMPLKWLCRLQGASPGARITGHDLLHAVAALAVERGCAVAFLGGGPGIAEAAAAKLAGGYPGLRIAGVFQGMFGPDGLGATERDEEAVVTAIQATRPDVLFVALGCPKQEMWIARHQQALGIPVAIGIGGVLDVMAGRFKRAPSWMQRTGLEWSYRLVQDPKRLWKRYVLEDAPTLSSCAVAAVRARSKGRSPAS